MAIPAYFFGSGILWAIPTITLAGVAVTYPTPVPFGGLQDVTIDLAWTTKELHGLYQLPLAIGRGTCKITGKAKAARITATLFNQCFGETQAAGETKVIFDEADTVTTNNITVAQNATWVLDLGVKYSNNGLSLTRLSAQNAVGTYSVAAGVYNFNSGDNNVAMKVGYTYTTATGPGQTFTINNQLIGLAPYFKAVLNGQFQGNNLTLTLNQCTASKLSVATKLEDFMIPEFDFGAMADSSNVLGTLSVASS